VAVVVVVVVVAAQVVAGVVFRFHQSELGSYRSSYRWVCEAYSLVFYELNKLNPTFFVQQDADKRIVDRLIVISEPGS
jgi:hypothetical protein